MRRMRKKRGGGCPPRNGYKLNSYVGDSTE